MSCSHKEPQIEKITGYCFHDSLNQWWQKSEYFVFYNPPKDSLELMLFIADFNKRTLSRDSILKYSGQYYRAFFKNTRQIRKVYEESRQKHVYIDIQDYVEDRLFNCDWRSYHDELGIIVGNYFIDRIWNAVGDEIYYPWRRDKYWREKELMQKRLKKQKLK
jgi:hypothetical protein